MVNRNLLRQYDLPEDELSKEIASIFDEGAVDWLPAESQDFRDNKIITGRVRGVTSDVVWVDVGYKSEGAIELREWFDPGLNQVVPPTAGDEIDVLLESVEDQGGTIVLSHRKARWQKEWQSVIAKHKEGDVVSGVVTRKIKGGLLVNIGINAFLPASQVDVRRQPDIGEFIGKTIDCKIIVIDEARRNIVVSRRSHLEDEREKMKKKLMAEIEPGQIRTGVVKNIAQFGAFVDLGGIDGLLHVTDMSWGRVNDPRQVVQIEQQLEVQILKVDKERGKIALSLKHKTPSPWANEADKYPVGSRHTGEIVNVVNYGAFVGLEPGIEGLVHISEMSWTKRIDHPSELVAIGDKIEVQVLSLNKEKHEISLGMKQVQPNPWDKMAESYPPGKVVSGIVRNLASYGAFIEIGDGIDGLLHVSDMSWMRNVTHPSELFAKGAQVSCVVLQVDQERKRIALGFKQMSNDPWQGEIQERYPPGVIKKGKVTKLAKFGVFVELEPGLEGLLHISELANPEVKGSEAAVKVGDEIEVKVLRVDAAERKIGLSNKPGNAQADGAEETEAALTSERPRELRGGTGSTAGQLFTMLESAKEPTAGSQGSDLP